MVYQLATYHMQGASTVHFHMAYVHVHAYPSRLGYIYLLNYMFQVSREEQRRFAPWPIAPRTSTIVTTYYRPFPRGWGRWVRARWGWLAIIILLSCRNIERFLHQRSRLHK